MTASLSTRASSSSEHPEKPPQLQAGGRGLPQGLHGAITGLFSLSQAPVIALFPPKDDLLKEEAVQHPASSIAKANK